MNTLLAVQSLTKEYGKEKVVKDVSFSLMKNTSTALIGPNGAGKTTTLSMLTGLVKPTSGEITLEENKGVPRSMIGFLPQYPTFFSWLSAMEFTEMTAKLSGVDARFCGTRKCKKEKNRCIFWRNEAAIRISTGNCT